MKDAVMFKYKVRIWKKTKYKEYWFYADTSIEEFLNKNNIKYVRDMIHPFYYRFGE